MLRYFRIMRLLRRVARLDVEPGDRRIVGRSLQSATGLVGDIWEPRRPASETIIAVHGMTLAGKDETRLQAFARAIAASGVRCIVPTVRGLSQMRCNAKDADDLAEIARETAQAYAPAMFFGFSLGGSSALLAAAKAGRAVKHVMTFGAAHDLARLFDQLHAKWTRGIPDDPRERRERLYVSLLMAYRRAVRQADRAPAAELEDFLRRFCTGLPDDESARLAERLEPLRAIAIEHGEVDRAELVAASPSGQMAGLTCSTGVIHDPTDPLVPVDHALALVAELESLHNGRMHRRLITELFDHVDIKGSCLLQLGKLVRILEPVVTASQTAS